MPREMHEHILERRLAERYRFNLVAKCLNQIANQLVPADSLDTNRPIDQLTLELEALENFPLQKIGRVGANHNHVAADFRLKLRRRRDSDQLPLVENPDPIASL